MDFLVDKHSSLSFSGSSWGRTIIFDYRLIWRSNTSYYSLNEIGFSLYLLFSFFYLFLFLLLPFFVFILLLTTSDHSPFEQDIKIIELLWAVILHNIWLKSEIENKSLSAVSSYFRLLFHLLSFFHMSFTSHLKRKFTVVEQLVNRYINLLS